MTIAEKITEKLLVSGALISASVTLLIFIFMLIPGIPLLSDGRFPLILFQPWQPGKGLYGIWPMITGSLSIAFISIVFAFPLSLGCSILISVLAPCGIGRILKNLVRLMTGIPTVVYGFVGVFLLVPFIRAFFQYGSGFCILAAAMLLAILISPTMILVFTDSFDAVPKSYLDALDAMGARRVQKLFYIIIPCSFQGILTGLILALGRAMGDTLISLMVAGNSIMVPGSVFDSARTLTAHIALVIAADFDSLEFKSIFACGMILYVFTTIIILLIRYVEYRGKFRGEP